jgi:hypothetical protein
MASAARAKTALIQHFPQRKLTVTAPLHPDGFCACFFNLPSHAAPKITFLTHG